jgi:hypothetical protein
VTRGNPTQHQNDYWPSYIGPSIAVTISGAPAKNPTVLAPGRYLIYCRESALYLRQGAADIGTSSADTLLARGVYRDMTVDDIANGFLSALTADGLGGVLRITKTSSTAGSPLTHQNDYWASYLGPTVSVPFTTPAARSTLLSPGRYVLHSPDAALYLLQGDSTVTTDANQFLLERGVYRDLTVDDATNGYVSLLNVEPGLTPSGTFRITKVSSES